MKGNKEQLRQRTGRESLWLGLACWTRRDLVLKAPEEERTERVWAWKEKIKQSLISSVGSERVDGYEFVGGEEPSGIE